MTTARQQRDGAWASTEASRPILHRDNNDEEEEEDHGGGKRHAYGVPNNHDTAHNNEGKCGATKTRQQRDSV